jgi:glycine cleavage system T protein
MTPLPDRARVVVVGGGITGTSVAYHLTELGWRDVVVLDRGAFPRTGSSTSHAPGLMFLHNNSQIMSRMAQYSADLYESLDWEDLPCYYRVGGVEVATTAARLDELKRKAGQMRSWGADAWMLTPDEAQKHVPMLDPSKILGAVFFPADGVTRAVRTVAALAAKASEKGASIHGDTPVTGFDVRDGRVRGVETPKGTIECEAVVLASGYWGPLVGALAGVTVPLRPMQHQYTKTVPLERYRGAAECIEPILRYQDMDMYFRQDGEQYGLGSYWHEPRLLEPHEVPTEAFSENGVSVLPFQEDDWAVPYAAAMELMPELKGVELPYRINGLLSWTPDGNPLIGESREVRGIWLAEAVWVTHGGGTGRMVAELMTSGETSWDTHEIDLYRFHDHVYAPDYIRQRGAQGYREAYDVIHPNYQAVHERGLRRSPFFETERELGAEFFETAGWERPQWYEANTPLLDLFPVQERAGWNALGWSTIEGAEHQAVRSRVGAFDISAFTKLVVSGPGSLAALERLCSNRIDRPIGRITYTSMLDSRGGIVCDLTVTRIAPDRFWIITGGAVGPHDLHWIRSHVPDDGSVHISDVTSSRAAVGLWGPRARALLAKLTEDDVSNEGFRYLTSGELYASGVLVGALRISYAGELGWEIYIPMEMGQVFWERLLDAGEEFGLVVAGAGAFDSLRLEKGYRGWGTDISTDYNPFEAGLGFAVRMDKGDFIGREALERIKAEGIKRKLCCLTVDDGQVVMGKEPIMDGDTVLGYVTSANYGYSVAKSIAYGYLPIEKSEPGTKVEITYFDERHPATVTPEPLFDPTNARLTH